jgi:hypothetical protein
MLHASMAAMLTYEFFPSLYLVLGCEQVIMSSLNVNIQLLILAGFDRAFPGAIHTRAAECDPDNAGWQCTVWRCWIFAGPPLWQQQETMTAAMLSSPFTRSLSV